MNSITGIVAQEISPIDVGWKEGLTPTPITAGSDFGTTIVSNSSSTPASSVQIQGKCFITQLQISQEDYEHHKGVAADYDNLIKRQLVTKLVEQLFTDKCIEFTKEIEYSEHKCMFRARIYATPDSQVKILREKGII